MCVNERVSGERGEEKWGARERICSGRRSALAFRQDVSLTHLLTKHIYIHTLGGHGDVNHDDKKSTSVKAKDLLRPHQQGLCGSTLLSVISNRRTNRITHTQTNP